MRLRRQREQGPGQETAIETLSEWLLGERRNAVVVLLTAAVLTVSGCALAYVRRRLFIVTVTGHSMAPTFEDGDRLLVRGNRGRRLRRGDVVILKPPGVRVPVGRTLREPGPGLQVKRVAALHGEEVVLPVRPDLVTVPPGTVVVRSDNAAAGMDSRHWGPYPLSGLVGVVVRRVAGARRTTHVAR